MSETMNEAGATGKVAVEKPPRSGAGIALSVFFSLAALGVASYPAWQAYKAATGASPVAAALAGVSARQTELARDLGALTDELGQVTTRLEAGEAGVRELRGQVAGELDALRNDLGSRPRDWLYTEVEYLVRMANQRALIQRDAGSALRLLEAADELVGQAEDPTAHDLRAALARDIAALKATAATDVQGVYLELSALISGVPALRRTLPSYEAPPPEEAPATDGGGALAVLKEAGGRLGSLIDFRRGEADIKPILPPEEIHYLRQNLVLTLQTAQLALLEGEAAVFHAAIGEASARIAGSFDADDPGAIAMRQTLAQLAGVDPGGEIPDMSASLLAARARLSEFRAGGAQ